LKLQPPQFKGGDDLTVEVGVQNTSTIEGDEVAELYLEFPPVAGAPARALRLAQGHVVAPGEYNMFVGGGQPGETPAGVRARVQMTGEFKLPR